ncbi:NAD-dependent epimerase/dehydratase family protein [Clostridium sp.]|uniref:NAD-dependent epimerase/dehydratase family protein n=1 Tax=Clostridium sp. TaxID=1506 RepID=UPI0026DA8BF9|nr:NAD-dependent epimerase/dehydratase family protein [Clostridium sp.]MDO5038083.1 NAD-dependent epimerase/dehydratase family protein [Clostridium sp.]
MGRILVFGGTKFLGKELVKELIINGHDITIATRGKNSDDFGDKVKRLIVDKENVNDLNKALEGKFYDVVYDTISYSSNDASRICNALDGKTNKYIVISSVAVYGKGYMLKERDFNPKSYKVIMGEKDDFSYAEGKRQMEAYMYQNANFPVISVRFPVVIGKDDYTKRLLKYFLEVKNKEKIYSTKINKKMNLITQSEAGIFLAWLYDKDIHGSINAACSGEVNLREIIECIEEEVETKALINSKEDVLDTSPYNKYLGLTVNIKNIMELGGYRFKNIHSEIKDIIKEYNHLYN